VREIFRFAPDLRNLLLLMNHILSGIPPNGKIDDCGTRRFMALKGGD
jgi:hypothetical protein